MGRCPHGGGTCGQHCTIRGGGFKRGSFVCAPFGRSAQDGVVEDWGVVVGDGSVNLFVFAFGGYFVDVAL